MAGSNTMVGRLPLLIPPGSGLVVVVVNGASAALAGGAWQPVSGSMPGMPPDSMQHRSAFRTVFFMQLSYASISHVSSLGAAIETGAVVTANAAASKAAEANLRTDMVDSKGAE